MQKIEGDK